MDWTSSKDIEDILNVLKQAFNLRQYSEPLAISACNNAWLALRSSKLSLSPEICQVFYEKCCKHIQMLESRSVQQNTLGRSFVVLIEMFGVILNFSISSEQEVTELITNVFKDYSKCLSYALFFCNYITALAAAIEHENLCSENSIKNTLENTISNYISIMLSTLKFFPLEEYKSTLEYIFSLLLLQETPLYFYVCRISLPEYLNSSNSKYIISLFSWLIGSMKEGTVHTIGKYCAMIYNWCSDEIKIQLIPIIESTIERERVFYKLCLYLVINEDSIEELKNLYTSITKKLKVKLLTTTKELSKSNHKDQQIKYMAMANIYINGLKCFTPTKDTMLVNEIIKAVKGFRKVIWHLPRALCSAELISNLLELHHKLQGALHFSDFYVYLGFLQEFANDKKALLITSIFLARYIHLDPPREIHAEVISSNMTLVL